MNPLVLPVELDPEVGAAFTGRDPNGPPAAGPPSVGAPSVGPPSVGVPGNLSHRRAHRPDELAAARAAVGHATATDPSRWHLMQQVHGAEVAVVDRDVEPGTELRGVDAAVTALPGRPLVVLVADCVPVLLAGPTTIGVAHAGRAGVVAAVVDHTLDALDALGDPPDTVTAVLGPAIGGCCYEVPAALQEEVVSSVPAARATTTWGTPSLDLPAAVLAGLRAREVASAHQVGGCTRCDPDQRWFSHRADPHSGRQAGLIVRRGRVS